MGGALAGSPPSCIRGLSRGSRKRRPNERWIDSIEEATSRSLQELSRAI